MTSGTERALVNMNHLASLPASHKGGSLLVELTFLNLALEIAVTIGTKISCPDISPANTAWSCSAELQTVFLRHPCGDGREVVTGEDLPCLGQSVAGVDGLPAVGSRHAWRGRHYVQVLRS